MENTMHVTPVLFYDNDQYHETRADVLTRIYGCLWLCVEFQQMELSIRDELAMGLELSCFNKTLDICTKKNIYKNWTEYEFILTYARETNRIISNIDMNSCIDNSTIIESIFNGTIVPTNIAYMSSRDLLPCKYILIEDQIYIRKQQKIEEKTSMMYRCPKCSHKETSTVPQQLRSLDEGANIRAMCKNCGHSWIAG